MACDIQKHSNPSSKVDSDTTTVYGWSSQLGTQTQAQAERWVGSTREMCCTKQQHVHTQIEAGTSQLGQVEDQHLLQALVGREKDGAYPFVHHMCLLHPRVLIPSRQLKQQVCSSFEWVQEKKRCGGGKSSSPSESPVQSINHPTTYKTHNKPSCQLKKKRRLSSVWWVGWGAIMNLLHCESHLCTWAELVP